MFCRANVLEEWITTLDTLPSDMNEFLLSIKSKDKEFQTRVTLLKASQNAWLKALKRVNQHKSGKKLNVIQNADGSIDALTVPASSTTGDNSGSTMRAQVDQHLLDCKWLADEKVQLAEQAVLLVERHLKKLDEVMKPLIYKQSLLVNEDNNNSADGIKMKKRKISSVMTTSNDDEPMSAYSDQSHGQKQFTAPLSAGSNRKSADDSIYAVDSLFDDEGNYVGSEQLPEATQEGDVLLTHPPNATYHDPSSTQMIEVTQDPQADEDSKELYCICQQPSSGAMIGCDNEEQCKYKWFHYECVGVTEAPRGAWYCTDCLSKGLVKRKRGVSTSKIE